ncbi:MAG: S-layer homology domain-containing protein, partial [Firmicutes bacterium]|nr:S-layer homology domain-containing protein [Bacillota bacterium]
YIFAHALPESELTAISNRIPPDVAATDKYADEILILYAAGVLCGNDEAGTFAGECAITRAEAAAIITRIALPSVRIAE